MPRFLLPLIALLFVTSPLLAQVFEIGGGGSTLYEAGGASIKVHSEGYDLTAGAGIVDGHLLEGIHTVRATPYGRLTAGDDRIDFRLPTDIFDSSHYLLVRGLSLATTVKGTNLLAFAGGTSADYSSPFFEGFKLNTPAALLFLHKKLSPRWQLFSDNILSSQQTSITSLQFTPNSHATAAFSAGIGSGQPYTAASVHITTDKLDVDAAYILAGDRFQRVAAATPLLAEPDKENLQFTLRPTSFLSLTQAHQNYLVPDYPSNFNLHSSVDQVSVGLRVLATQLSATLYHSSFQQPVLPVAFAQRGSPQFGAASVPPGTFSNHAAALTATRYFGPRIQVISSYFASRPKGYGATNSLNTMLSEVINPHITINENISTSRGQTSINFGGEFLSNLLTVSANYETFYVPTNIAQPFEQALILDVKLTLFGRLFLHGATLVDPTGHLRYTADANTIATRGRAAAPLTEHVAMGNARLRGCVTDPTGAPIEGAALLIGAAPVFTDSSGCFLLRERRPAAFPLRVQLDDFLDGGRWQLVSAPTSLLASTIDNEPAPTIVVRRLPAVAASNTSPADAPTTPVADPQPQTQPQPQSQLLYPNAPLPQPQ